MEDINLYDLLSIKFDSTDKEIRKAYRKKALTCHPDKNSNDKNAAVQFHQLSKALEILLDPAAKKAYDKVLKAREAARIRSSELNSIRKKFKAELEEREERAAQTTNRVVNANDLTAEQKLQKEIARLRKEGSKLLEEEVENVRKQLLLERDDTNSINYFTLRVQWKAQARNLYDYSTLERIFSKYGQIDCLLSKEKCAFLDYKEPSSAVTAMREEKGFAENPLKIKMMVPDSRSRTGTTWKNVINSPKSEAHPSPSSGRTSRTTQTAQQQKIQMDSLEDFEAQVLRKLSEAQKRKTNADVV